MPVSFAFSQYQSAYRTGHSTETALLEVLDGVYTAADNKQISMLIGLDLSAAFDTVDHSLLIERLQLEFGVNDTALDWLRSYLVDRVQFVKMGEKSIRHGCARRRRSAGVCTRPVVVCRVLQSGG